MVKLKTEDQEYIKYLMEQLPSYLGPVPGPFEDVFDDALAAREMKPEYDRMKAKIAEIMAMKPKTNNVTTDAFDGYENNGWNKALKEIKAILERGV